MEYSYQDYINRTLENTVNKKSLYYSYDFPYDEVLKIVEVQKGDILIEEDIIRVSKELQDENDKYERKNKRKENSERFKADLAILREIINKALKQPAFDWTFGDIERDSELVKSIYLVLNELTDIIRKDNEAAERLLKAIFNQEEKGE